ncbi:hypothetical protein AU192_01260 [Mycobacterium lehmannii]|uniref:Uncharacterized protein n=1 Tax=Mycobacterium lehmannii TaxID=2048550 RepID=A0A101A8S0_9MYCO|nr:hypothetical protein [Mycobacterium lehmannii]KUI17370.1 hypothetical protein AU192_01260 [Mycobacterium lehmannii]
MPSANADGDELTRRAFAAYFRTGGTEQPARSGGVVERDGLLYVVLRHSRGLLGVYRVRNNGMLRRMRRSPADLED